MIARAAVCVAAALAACGCAALRPLVAPTGDLADYRAFRVAAHPGTRLSRAQRYLEAHPRGAWATEVRAAFEEEEPAYFEAATATRAGTSDYLADLPRGPHADAAVALLTAYDTKVDDAATARLLRDARRTEAMLDRAAAQRRTVGEAVLADLAALLDENVYGARIEDAPAPLRRALGGLARPTWGGLPARREEDLFFSLPTRPERESRLVTVAIAVDRDRGRVVAGRIEGADLFVHWTEADEMRALDPTDGDDRAAAADHARDVLAGALEARFPASKCAVRGATELLARACDGWRISVRMGSSAGEKDGIGVAGPPSRANERANERAAEAAEIGRNPPK